MPPCTVYCSHQALFDDLTGHFQICRHADQVGQILVNLLKTDFAFGLATECLNALRGKQDTLLTMTAQAEVLALRGVVVDLWCHYE